MTHDIQLMIKKKQKTFDWREEATDKIIKGREKIAEILILHFMQLTTNLLRSECSRSSSVAM